MHRIKFLYFDKYFKFFIISLFLKKVALLIFFDKKGTIIRYDNNKMMGELFGEDQSRYIITISPELESIFEKKMKKRGVKFELIGCITSSQLKINDSVIISSNEIRDAYESLIPSIMNNMA